MSPKISSMAKKAHEATRAVVRILVQGFSETDPRSILDPRFAAPEQWSASGFFIQLHGESGYILTNSHVVRNSVRIEVRSTLTSDETFRAEVLGMVEDLEPDVALLRLGREDIKRFLKLTGLKKIPALKLGFDVKVYRGEEVKTIGFPLGVDEPHFSGGEISNFIAGSGDTTERMVTDAAINFGNSGGPALVEGGWVVGINTAVIEGAENFSFITPIHLAKHVLETFLKKDKASLSRLGLLIQKNSDWNSRVLGVPADAGVIVRKVFPGSPAASMGLQSRDVILAIAGEALDRHGNVLPMASDRKRNIYDAIHDVPEGGVLDVAILRRKKHLNLRGRMFAWESGEISRRPVLVDRAYLSFGGMILQDICTDVVSALIAFGYSRDQILRDFYLGGSKLVVSYVVPGSPADEMGISVADFVTSVQGAPVGDVPSFAKELTLARGRKPASILVEMVSGAFGNFMTSRLAAEDLEIQMMRIPGSATLG
ncbi:trypsin-like peptidase domain-containing protein [Bdellovibrio bacteriovorus]|nr:trypsin-like peptidase domain-containing protein [Bdellovibrio bacteriovorus]